MKFDRKILVIGYGAVSKCTIPVLLKHVDVNPGNISIIDFEDKEKDLRQWTEKGVKYYRQKIEESNLEKVLSQHLEKGGLCIDLAWNIGCNDIVKWCHDNNVLYVNTSVEQWDPKGAIEKTPTNEKTLYHRQMRLRELSRNWKNAQTAVLDHGANPGLISHFTKQALIDISSKLIYDGKVSGDNARYLDYLVQNRSFGELAREIGVKVIHCSERDTQITNNPKKVDEFVGTWSIEGLREEGTAPAEMGWGTHEKELPLNSGGHKYGPKNQIFLEQMGIDTWVWSWIPDEQIVGMVIRHGEAFGISDRFSVHENGKVVYRPTVHYAYMPCHETLASLCELRGRGYEMQSKLRILDDSEITSGADILGALVMGHEYNSWWTGSILGINESRFLAPGQNATTIQVALGVVSAAMFAIENPKKGICLPDDLPHDYVLNIAKPYLGEFVSKQSDWTPLKNRKKIFKGNNLDYEDVWQFKNFLYP